MGDKPPPAEEPVSGTPPSDAPPSGTPPSGTPAPFDRFAEFVRASRGSLTGAAYLLTGDHHTAEDLVQDTYARLARHWSRVARDGADPMPYARTILYRRWIDGWRWRRRRPEQVLAELPDRPNPSHAGLEDAVVLRHALLVALADLTARQRAVLVLRFLEDRTEAAVAEVLGCSVSTVKSTTREALARVRERHPELLPAASIDGLREADPASEGVGS